MSKENGKNKIALNVKPTSNKKSKKASMIVKRANVSKSNVKKSESNKPRGIKFLGGLLLSKMAKGGAAELRDKAEEVNRLNVFPVPDGDTGDNMSLTIDSGVAAIEKLDTDNLADAMEVFSHGMLLGARGNSGVILSQFFSGVSKGLEGIKKADAETFGHALELGVKQAYTSVMTPTEGTILTVAREAVAYAVSRINSTSTIRSLFNDLVNEMHLSLERTPEILKVLKEADVVDSGGAGLFYIMDGFNRVLNGEKIKSASPVKPSNSAHCVNDKEFGADSEMIYGYCTEVLLQLQNKKTDILNFDVEALKDFLSNIGDSIVAFKTESIVKVHVHTFEPEKVIGHLRTFGEFISVKIENMSLQHTENTIKEENAEKKAITDTAIPKKKNGVVAVCIGEGISNLFKELGADEIIAGGQTQNPSTNDFLDAFNRINAENIFVFPNNSNIVMAAEQAGEIYKNANVYVLKSKNIGMGYAALSSADLFSDNAEEICSVMNSAMQKISSGYVSPAIRDTEMNGFAISSGDTIGIVDKEIVAAASGRNEASIQLVRKLLSSPDKFMLTVFRGKDATDEETNLLTQDINNEYPNIELYFIDGGQEIYPFIFVAE